MKFSTFLTAVLTALCITLGGMAAMADVQRSVQMQECGSVQNPKGHKYALCWDVVCKKLPNGQAECACPVYEGNNWGNTSCEQRDDILKTGWIYSEYSPKHLLADGKDFEPASFCTNPNGWQYADCYNKPCKMNGDGKTADCVCDVITTGTENGFIAESPNCQEARARCQQYSGKDSSWVMNGADVLIGSRVVETALQQSKAMGSNRSYESFYCAAESTNQGGVQQRQQPLGVKR